jgi:hypothetical protein
MVGLIIGLFCRMVRQYIKNVVGILYTQLIIIFTFLIETTLNIIFPQISKAVLTAVYPNFRGHVYGKTGNLSYSQSNSSPTSTFATALLLHFLRLLLACINWFDSLSILAYLYQQH